MKTNTIIPLTPNSKERTDALNTIKYTLLLDYHAPELDSDEVFIEQILTQCQKCCTGLFCNYNEDSDSGNTEQKLAIISHDFFGLSLSSNSISRNFNIDSPSNKLSLCRMILDHCIISSYHAILTELSENSTITSYGIVNKTKDQGIRTLLSKRILRVDEKGLISNAPAEEKKSSKASDFSRTTERHIKKLSFITPFIYCKEGDEFATNKYPLQFSELCYTINGIRATDFSILKFDTQQSLCSNNLLDSVFKLLKQLCPRYSSSTPSKRWGEHRNKTDFIYHYYITERAFNLNLYFSLLKNIKQIEQRTNYRLSQKDTLDILCLCHKLPNAFSRQLFIKYAFQQIIEEPGSYLDYWLSQDLTKSSSIVTSTRTLPKGFQFSKWLEQYKLFINYLSEFIIPVYEWCFLNMLLEPIEKKYADKSHFFHLHKAMDYLTNYLDNDTHAEDILQPIKLSAEKSTITQTDMSILSVVAPFNHYNDLIWLPDDTISYVSKQLLTPSISLDLNLKPLNPSFFKSEKPDSNESYFEKNTDRIRKFYIDLIRYRYLE